MKRRRLKTDGDEMPDWQPEEYKIEVKVKVKEEEKKEVDILG